MTTDPKLYNNKHCNEETYGGMAFMAIYIVILMAIGSLTFVYCIFN